MIICQPDVFATNDSIQYNITPRYGTFFGLPKNNKKISIIFLQKNVRLLAKLFGGLNLKK